MTTGKTRALLSSWLVPFCGGLLLFLWAPVAAFAGSAAAPEVESRPEEVSLQSAADSARSRLQALASNDPEAFGAILQQAFGDRLSTAARQELVRKATRGNLPEPARITFVPNAVLGGASAAYLAENGGVILLSADLLGNAEALQELITEEWGHHLDASLGEGDAPGDEGEIFARGIQQSQPIPESVRRLLTLQDDQALIQWEERTLLVEMGFGKWIKKAGKSISKAAQTTGKAVSSAAQTVASKTVKATSIVGVGIADAVVNTAVASVTAVKNLGESTGNFVSGSVNQLAAGVAASVGNDALASQYQVKADRQIARSKQLAEEGASNVLDAVTAPGNAYLETVEKLDKVVPFLGTILDLAVSLTPLGPYLAVAKGTSEVTAAIKAGDTKAALLAGGFAALDVGGSAIGRVAAASKTAQTTSKAAKAAMASADAAKATDKAFDAALAANRAMTAAKRTGKLADEAADAVKVANKPWSAASAADKLTVAQRAREAAFAADDAAAAARSATRLADDAAKAAADAAAAAAAAVSKKPGIIGKVFSMTDPVFLTANELATGTKLAKYLSTRPIQQVILKGTPALLAGGKILYPTKPVADYVYNPGVGKRWQTVGTGLTQRWDEIRTQVKGQQLQPKGRLFETFVEAPVVQPPASKAAPVRRPVVAPAPPPVVAPAPPAGGGGGGGGGGGVGGG